MGENPAKTRNFGEFREKIEKFSIFFGEKLGHKK